MLKRMFPATHQLIRAHVDFLLMSMLLVVNYYLCTRFELVLNNFFILCLCVGAIYNPIGFIVLAVKPAMGNPKTRLEKARVLLGFLPATIGFSATPVLLLAKLT